MYVMTKGPVAYFDVDDTLLEWEESESGIKVDLDGYISKKQAITQHIDELIRQKKSGTSIIVWSASGVQWAEAVVKALKIEEYVDAVLSKPTRVYDDKDPIDWLPERRFFL